MTNDSEKRRFVELVTSQGPRLRRLARSYARGDDAPDLLQEMLLQIWRSWPRFRGDASLETWAYRIAINTGLSHLRREIGRRQVVDAGDPAAAVERVSGPGSESTEQMRILDDFLGSLGPLDRTVMLGYLEGLTHQQLSEAVGCSIGAVAVRISRLKSTFKQRYVGG